MRDIDRYLKLAMWARKRYAVNGKLIVNIGGKPTLYSRIEDAAAVKFMGGTRIYPQ